MKKRILIALLVGVMLLTGCGSGKSSGTEKTSKTTGAETTSEKASDSTVNTEDVTKLVVTFRTFGTVPADLLKVQEKINEITIKKINAEVELVVIPSGSYKQQMTLMLSGDEQLDVMGANSTLIPSSYASEAIRPLDDLVEKYGQGIKEALGEKVLACGNFAGKLYSIPIKADTANGMGSYVLRKDICDKYNIDVASIDSYEKLGEAFALVHEKEPEMMMLANASVGYSALQYNVCWDKLGDNFGVLADKGQNLKVVNLFETNEYKNYVNVFRDWYQKGYMSKDITNATESGGELMKAGNLFAYPTSNKPGIEIQEQNNSGYEVNVCQVLDTITVTGNNWQWTIPENSKNPEKAMEFLNLMYTDSDIINLLAYGIEGEHYVVQDDGTINYPEGIDATKSSYNMGSMVWSFGNEFNAYVWNGNDSDLWNKTEEWNKTGVVSKAYGFTFNNLSVSTELAAVQNVYDQYRMSLECGVVDPETTLAEMNKKLYDAGLQNIIDEKQKQLDEWATKNNVQ
jgi:ABC-type sugar transport system, periplasmic component